MSKQSKRPNYDRRMKRIANLSIRSEDFWNLDITFATFILPRLKQCHARHADFASAGVMKKIIRAFTIILSPDYFKMDDKKRQQVNEGLELFASHYTSMWT